MQSIDHFNQFTEDDDEDEIEEEYFLDDNGKRKRRLENDIDDITEDLSRIKVKKFKMEDYSFHEPTYLKIQSIVTAKIQKLTGLFSYKSIDKCIMSGCFLEHNIKTDWNVVVNILSVTKEGIKKSYNTEKLNDHTIITFGSTIRSIFVPIMSSHNNKVRSITCELIINIEKNFLKEKFIKTPDKIELKTLGKMTIETFVPDLSSLKIGN